MNLFYAERIYLQLDRWRWTNAWRSCLPQTLGWHHFRHEDAGNILIGSDDKTHIKAEGDLFKLKLRMGKEDKVISFWSIKLLASDTHTVGVTILVLLTSIIKDKISPFYDADPCTDSKSTDLGVISIWLPVSVVTFFFFNHNLRFTESKCWRNVD